jgi:RNA polymerase sigma factor (sigma-70 family)
MTGNPHDAEDVSQEVLIKILTRLSSFTPDACFRTWLYRIVKNHVLNMKTRGAERYEISFTAYGKGIEATPDLALPAQQDVPVPLAMLMEEVRLECMAGMIMCLNREQRFTFILGEILGVKDTQGGAILEISKAAYRQRLCRARRQMYHFMKAQCGLIRKQNPCRCGNKLKALIQRGVVDPDNLKFQRQYIHKVKDLCPERYMRLTTLIDIQCRQQFRNMPFNTSPDFVQTLQRLLASKELRKLFEVPMETQPAE